MYAIKNIYIYNIIIIMINAISEWVYVDQPKKDVKSKISSLVDKICISNLITCINKFNHIF